MPRPGPTRRTSAFVVGIVALAACGGGAPSSVAPQARPPARTFVAPADPATREREREGEARAREGRPQKYADHAFTWVFPDAVQRKAKTQRLAAAIEKLLDAEHDRGATGSSFAFALVVDGEVVVAKARGVADLENKRVATPETVYRIASITKTFTASMVMRLRDEGKLSLADPVAMHLRELDVAYPHKDDAPIRIEQMLTHSAGLARSGPYAELARPSTEADLVSAMALPLTSDPGLSHAYSNLAFGLLGLLVGRAYGVPYRDAAQDKLLGPLGMRSSSFDLGAFPAERLAVGYRREGGKLVAVPMTKNGAGEGAGGLFTTARDMAEWIRFQLAAWPPRDDADEGPIHRATLREMHTPRLAVGLGSSTINGGVTRAHAKSVGLAWEVSRGCHFDRLVGHDGDLDGFHARLRFDPSRDLGFVLLFNSDNADASGIAERIVDTIAAGPSGPSGAPRSATDEPLAARIRAPSAELVSLVSDAVGRLGSLPSEDYERIFTETYRTTVPLTMVHAIGNRAQRDVGGCTYVGAERVVDATDAELAFRCARGRLYVSARGTGTPLRLFGFSAEAATKLDPDQLAVGKALLPRMTTKDDTALEKALRTKLPVGSSSRALARVGLEVGACRIADGEALPWIRAASFRLECARGQATMKLAQHDDGALEVTKVDVAPRCLR